MASPITAVAPPSSFPVVWGSVVGCWGGVSCISPVFLPADLKAMMGDVMRIAVRVDPLTSFCLAEEWLQFQLSAPVDPGENCSKAGDGLCSLLSPSYIQWDAMTFFCECVISQVLRVLPKE
ncbi:hypothetical protein GDO81_018834, partial [Engystomops pustulosus]